VRHLLRLLPLLLVALAGGCGSGSAPSRSEIAVDVQEVALDPMGSPMILLKERGGLRTLPIWIGMAEARSIASELEDIEPPRPNTHDLAKRLIDGLGARVERVVVTELRDRTYYGLIMMAGPAGALEVDARPSDAIALALRLGAPIFVHEGLLEETEEDEEEPEVGDEPPGREVQRRPDAEPPEQAA